MKATMNHNERGSSDTPIFDESIENLTIEVVVMTQNYSPLHTSEGKRSHQKPYIV